MRKWKPALLALCLLWVAGCQWVVPYGSPEQAGEERVQPCPCGHDPAGHAPLACDRRR